MHDHAFQEFNNWVEYQISVYSLNLYLFNSYMKPRQGDALCWFVIRVSQIVNYSYYKSFYINDLIME
jgi:hypothetical protein